MARFAPDRPIVTDEPRVTVDAGLRPGDYRFQLVVVDNEGNRSLPDTVLVTVLPRASGRFVVGEPLTSRVSGGRPRRGGRS